MSFALILAIILELVVMSVLEPFLGGLNSFYALLLMAVAVAPVIEEFTKATGIMTVMRG